MSHYNPKQPELHHPSHFSLTVELLSAVFQLFCKRPFFLTLPAHKTDGIISTSLTNKLQSQIFQKSATQQQHVCKVLTSRDIGTINLVLWYFVESAQKRTAIGQLPHCIYARGHAIRLRHSEHFFTLLFLLYLEIMRDVFIRALKAWFEVTLLHPI